MQFNIQEGMVELYYITVWRTSWDTVCCKHCTLVGVHSLLHRSLSVVFLVQDVLVNPFEEKQGTWKWQKEEREKETDSKLTVDNLDLVHL